MCCFFSLSHVIGSFESLLSQLTCHPLKLFPAHLGKASPVVPHLHFFSFLSKFTSLGCLHFINSLPRKNAHCTLYKCYLPITPNTSIPRIVPVPWWYLLNVCRIKALFIVSSKWKSGATRMTHQVKKLATESEDLNSILGILQVVL